MISFEVSAIDLILVISVVILLILHMTNYSVNTTHDKKLSSLFKQYKKTNRFAPAGSTNHTECPRGYGNIKSLGDNNSVSDRCLGCYMIMDCYKETK